MNRLSKLILVLLATAAATLRANDATSALHWYEITMNSGATYTGSILATPEGLSGKILKPDYIVVLDNLSVAIRDVNGSVTWKPEAIETKRKVFLNPRLIASFREYPPGMAPVPAR